MNYIYSRSPKVLSKHLSKPWTRSDALRVKADAAKASAEAEKTAAYRAKLDRQYADTKPARKTSQRGARAQHGAILFRPEVQRDWYEKQCAKFDAADAKPSQETTKPLVSSEKMGSFSDKPAIEARGLDYRKLWASSSRDDLLQAIADRDTAIDAHVARFDKLLEVAVCHGVDTITLREAFPDDED